MNHNYETLAVLLIAFRRLESIKTILDCCHEAGVRRIYVTIDRATNEDDQYIQDSISNILEAYYDLFESLVIHKRDRNVGCAVSVLTGLDWIFSHETFVCVLEDDCIPSADFFDFIRDSKPFLETEDDLMLACGTQFAPEHLTKTAWMKSTFSLTWGWATTRSKWIKMRSYFFQDEDYPKSFSLRNSPYSFFKPSYSYWNFGAKRAYKGFVDVWDTILVRNLYNHNERALLPPSSLVNNIGSDLLATHTKKSEWTNRPTGIYKSTEASPQTNREIDMWLKKHFFKISFRHLFTTRFTALKDKYSKPPRSPLLNRWIENQIIES